MRVPRAAFWIVAGGALGTLTHAGETRWLKLTSPHFEMYTQAGERSSRDALVRFEQVRSFFARSLGSGRDFLRKRVRIVAFGSSKEYEPYRHRATSAAYYVSAPGRDYIVLGGIGGDVLPVAMHEYVHLVIQHSGFDIPLWLNEGLAELYSTLKPLGGKLAVGDVPSHRMAHLRSSRWLDLETLTSVRDLAGPEWSPERVQLFYSQSWALSHMLLLSGEYRTRCEEFANTLPQGATAAAAFAKVYGKSLEQVQRDLAGYLRSDRFAAALFDAKLEKLAEAPRAQPVPELESGLLLSELLVLLGRDAEAEKSLEKPEARMPGRWEIGAVRGRAALRRGRSEEALRCLARAADSEEADADVRLEYARLLAASGENVEAAIRQLERVLQAEPESAEAHYYLGLMLLRRAEYGRALGSFARIRNRPPELAYPFFMALSRTYYHLGDRAETLKAAQRARQYVRNDEEAKAAAQLVGALEAGREGGLVAEVSSDSFRMREERPEVRRRPAGPPPPAPPAEVPGLPSVSGTLEQVDCLGNRARLRIMSAGKPVALLVEDPAAVVVVGEAGILELTCGPQKPRPVTIEYRPRDDPETGTIGVAVLIRLP